MAGPLGPDMAAGVAFFKGACHISYTTIHRVLHELLRLDVSRAMLAKAREKVSPVPRVPCQSLVECLPQESQLDMRRSREHPWAKKLARRVRAKATQYDLLVITERAVEPTNSGTERRMCPVVVDRLITQGTHAPPARGGASASGPLCHLQEARSQCVRVYPSRLAGSLQQHRLPCTTVNGSIFWNLTIPLCS